MMKHKLRIIEKNNLIRTRSIDNSLENGLFYDGEMIKFLEKFCREGERERQREREERRRKLEWETTLLNWVVGEKGEREQVKWKEVAVSCWREAVQFCWVRWVLTLSFSLFQLLLSLSSNFFSLSLFQLLLSLTRFLLLRATWKITFTSFYISSDSLFRSFAHSHDIMETELRTWGRECKRNRVGERTG